MATPNYGFEKRQRELAKKRKKEEKLKAKADRKVGPGEGGDEVENDQSDGAAPGTDGGSGEGGDGD